MFPKILIANRGEIACRIIRTCRRLGIATVAIHSTAEGAPLHAELADEAVILPESPNPLASYLDVDNIVSIARETPAPTPSIPVTACSPRIPAWPTPAPNPA